MESKTLLLAANNVALIDLPDLPVVFAAEIKGVLIDEETFNVGFPMNELSSIELIFLLETETLTGEACCDTVKEAKNAFI